MANKTIVIGLGILGVTILAHKFGIPLVKKAVASNKLDVNIDKLESHVKLSNLISLSPSVNLIPIFRIDNPTDQEFTITQPIVKLVYTGTSNTEAQIGASIPSDTKITIKAKSSTTIRIPIKLMIGDIISNFSKPVEYFASRLKGMPSTRKVRADYQFDTEGITISDFKLLAI